MLGGGGRAHSVVMHVQCSEVTVRACLEFQWNVVKLDLIVQHGAYVHRVLETQHTTLLSVRSPLGIDDNDHVMIWWR